MSLSHGDGATSDMRRDLPQVGNSNCATEQAAYAAAAATHQAAEQTLTQAYNDWSQCESGGYRPDSDFVNPITADDSILKK